ncbi:MAG: hypothetical protein MHPSP_001655, partial [Paramarteilia canceri]
TFVENLIAITLQLEMNGGASVESKSQTSAELKKLNIVRRTILTMKHTAPPLMIQASKFFMHSLNI